MSTKGSACVRRITDGSVRDLKRWRPIPVARPARSCHAHAQCILSCMRQPSRRRMTVSPTTSFTPTARRRRDPPEAVKDSPAGRRLIRAAEK